MPPTYNYDTPAESLSSKFGVFNYYLGIVLNLVINLIIGYVTCKPAYTNFVSVFQPIHDFTNDGPDLVKGGVPFQLPAVAEMGLISCAIVGAGSICGGIGMMLAIRRGTADPVDSKYMVQNTNYRYVLGVHWPGSALGLIPRAILLILQLAGLYYAVTVAMLAVLCQTTVMEHRDWHDQHGVCAVSPLLYIWLKAIWCAGLAAFAGSSIYLMQLADSNLPEAVLEKWREQHQKREQLLRGSNDEAEDLVV